MAAATTQANGYSTTAFQGLGQRLSVLDVTHEVTTAELETGDVIQFGKVPKGAIYVDGYLACDDLDSNGAPTLNLEVGDEDDVDGLLDGTTAGQSAAVTRFAGAYITNRAAITGEKTIAVKVTAGAATAAAGTIRVVLYYWNP